LLNCKNKTNFYLVQQSVRKKRSFYWFYQFTILFTRLPSICRFAWNTYIERFFCKYDLLQWKIWRCFTLLSFWHFVFFICWGCVIFVRPLINTKVFKLKSARDRLLAWYRNIYILFRLKSSLKVY